MRYAIFLLCSMLLSAPSWAAPRVIELNDGTRIVGEVVEVRNGIWVVESKTLGRVSVPEERIRSMGSGAESGDQTGTAGAIQQKIAADAGLMAQIMALRNDPAMQAALQDPEVMRAVRELDFDALRSNPRFQALMKDPDIQDITSSLR